MAQGVHGIHHVTCIAGDPQENHDFYVGALGMRLVKKSVNQEVPDTYHLFERLILPPWLEPKRAEIENALKPIKQQETISNLTK